MALNKQQFLELRKQGLSVDQIVRFESGENPSVTKQTAGNQFQQTATAPQKPRSYLKSATLGGGMKDFVVNLIGGGKLAEGAGMSLAAPGVQKDLSQATKGYGAVELQAIKKLQELKARGEDTSVLEQALKKAGGHLPVLADAQNDFTAALPTNKEVIGSSLRLGSNALGAYAAPAFTRAFAIGKAPTMASGALRGLGAGASSGALVGGAQGAGIGLENNLDAAGVAMSAGAGALTGAVAGGAIGAVGGGITGKLNQTRNPDRVLDFVTPEARELTPTQYKKALAQGKITPKTTSSPAKFTLPDAARDTALKYPELINKDPVKTTVAITDKIAGFDDEVGTFLRQNNGIFSKGELRNALKASMDEVTDITVDETRLQTIKSRLIDNFVKSLETNDMETLWMARKDYDQVVDKAFTGSPTLQKEVKIALRNAVQDYIAERTPNETYRQLMKEMTNLFRLRDFTAVKASKQRALSGLQLWIKQNPKKAQAAAAAALLAANNFIVSAFPFKGGSGGNSQ